MLNRKECQKIIDRLVHIIGKDMNIIGLDGNIIASTKKERIDTFHEGAKLCVESGKELIITESNKHHYKGCEPGINLPLYYENRLIGILGLTGNKDEVRGYGLIVKELVEHIVHGHEYQQFKLLQQEALRSFIIELFNARAFTDYSTLENRAKLMGFKYDKLKTVVIGDIYSNDNNKNDGVSTEIIKQRILKTIKMHLDVDDIGLILYENLFIIIMNWRGNMETYLNNIIQSVDNKYNIKLRLVIGGKCDKLQDYSKRFNSAKRVLDMNMNINIKEGVHFADTYELELLLGSLRERSIQEYLECYEEIFREPLDRGTKEIIDTIKVYFEQNMNIGETASTLFVHRNTIGYRLNKFKEQYKININKPYECMKLYIAIKLYNQIESSM